MFRNCFTISEMKAPSPETIFQAALAAGNLDGLNLQALFPGGLDAAPQGNTRAMEQKFYRRIGNGFLFDLLARAGVLDLWFRYNSAVNFGKRLNLLQTMLVKFMTDHGLLTNPDWIRVRTNNQRYIETIDAEANRLINIIDDNIDELMHAYLG